MFKFFEKKAFTLAEILITLGIIGVIAAITISNLSVYIKGKRLQSQFKKAYADLNQAAQDFYEKEGQSVTNYNLSENSETSHKTLIKYTSFFKGSSILSENVDSFDANNNLSNLNLARKSSNYPCDQSGIAMDILGRLYSMDDNVSVYTFTEAYGPKVCVDINGKNKPNQWGIDRFAFVFKNNSVVPYTGSAWSTLTVPMTSETEIAKYCNSKITTPTHTCAYFALIDKNPEGSGTYWYDFIKGK